MFASAEEFVHFEVETKWRRRFFLDERCTRFLADVRETAARHVLEVPEDQLFWRAQIAHKLEVATGGIGPDIVAPAPPERMKPLRGRAVEGRANYKGIPHLYVASDPNTAIAEVRPGLGSLVTLACVRFPRALKLVDCGTAKPFGMSALAAVLSALEPAQIEVFIWSSINEAFSEPVSRSDDAGEYVATQILAELFKSMGFDGVAYRSGFGENGFNMVAFEPDPAEIASCSLYRLTSVSHGTRLAGETKLYIQDIPLDRFTWNPLDDGKGGKNFLMPMPPSQPA
jgi:hypothetical protein